MLITFAQLRDNVLDRVEEETGASRSEFAGLVSEFLDRAYFDLLGRRPWVFSWAPNPLVLELDPPLTTLTLSQQADSYGAALSASVAKSLIGWKVIPKPPGQPSPNMSGIRILDHTGAGLLLEERPAAAFVAVPCVVYRDEYEMLEILIDPPTPVSATLVAQFGQVPVGTYTYVVSLLGTLGETIAGPASAPVVVTDPSIAGQIALALPHSIGPRIRARVIYRSLGGGPYQLVGTLDGRLDGTFVDNVATPVEYAPSEVNGTHVVRHISGVWCRSQSGWEIVPLDINTMRDRWSLPVEGTTPPRAYARIGQSRIRFSEYSTVRDTLDIEHTEIAPPISGCKEHEIQVPRQWRWVLADYALGLTLEQKHMERSKYWLDRAEANIVTMVQEDEKTKHGYDSLRRGGRNESGR